jgi:glycosyltransferase involved in cell wall biosynthesis
MRILLLIPTLTGGGAERQLAYLGGELQRRGHDVLAGFLHHGTGAWPDEIPTHPFARHSRWSEGLIRDIVRLIRAWKPDVVQTCITRMDVAGGIAANVTRVPHVLREPNTAAAYRDIKSRLRRFIGRRAAAIVANSDAGAAYWAHARTFVIPNAVPFDEISRAELLSRPDDAALVLYAGRLEPQKNVDVVLRAFAMVAAERPAQLTICGDGPQREHLEALARELRIDDRVNFAGFVQNIWSYQRAADVALLVSDFEGHPNVVSECFAAGAPMILSDIPVHRSLAEENSLLVPPRDVAATADAIRNVLDDRTAARERAARARARVSEISIPRMAAAYEDVYAVVQRACIPR